uniref:Cytochrome c biogenesis protein CcsA n=1 Tax=Ostreobium sp. HV05007bc TaxID=1940403 RepID=A0A2P0QI66_9CHLO|nr:cytochrome c biogenesis protein ccs1 [Ostreobium sp. HV05007bc]
MIQNNWPFENLLINCSFIFLFIAMICYWVYLASFFKNIFLKLGQFSNTFANFSIFASLVLRWINSGHFPLSNLYESLIFLSWCLSLIHIVLERATQNNFVGALLSPTTLFINSFALFNLPADMRQISPLIPALQSNWLMMHVSVMLLSYAALFSGTLLSISFLILSWIQTLTISDTSKIALQNLDSSSSKAEISISSKKKKDSFLDFLNCEYLNNLDNLSYRLIGIGFSFLTIGILSGAVWANEAWGSYWSWDPKETWALIAWITFAIYLHTRLVKGWKGQKPAIVALFGFFILWICYLGVNLLGKGLHSYGWFL